MLHHLTWLKGQPFDSGLTGMRMTRLVSQASFHVLGTACPFPMFHLHKGLFTNINMPGPSGLNPLDPFRIFLKFNTWYTSMVHLVQMATIYWTSYTPLFIKHTSLVYKLCLPDVSDDSSPFTPARSYNHLFWFSITKVHRFIVSSTYLTFVLFRLCPRLVFAWPVYLVDPFFPSLHLAWQDQPSLYS